MAVPTSFPRKWLIIPVFFLVLLIVFSFIPVPKADPENCIAVKAIVEKVEKGSGEADIVLTLGEDDAYYYINRGMDHGLEPETLAAQLVKKTATIYYVRHWSVLNLFGKTRHVARVEAGGQVLYNEWPPELD